MRIFIFGGLLAGLVLAIGPTKAQDVADRIWRNGPILTMNDDALRAEAVAEKDGKIVAVGSDASELICIRARPPSTPDHRKNARGRPKWWT